MERSSPGPSRRARASVGRHGGPHGSARAMTIGGAWVEIDLAS